eukprot:7645929-Pyramimonas_sp.AAC.1
MARFDAGASETFEKLLLAFEVGTLSEYRARYGGKPWSLHQNPATGVGWDNTTPSFPRSVTLVRPPPHSPSLYNVFSLLPAPPLSPRLSDGQCRSPCLQAAGADAPQLFELSEARAVSPEEQTRDPQRARVADHENGTWTDSRRG